MSARLGVVAVLSLLLLAACKRQEQRTPETCQGPAAAGRRPPEPGARPQGASPGCARGSQQPGAFHRKMTVAGQPRTYWLVAPPGGPGRAPLPLIFVFHGLGGSGARARSRFGL